MKEYRGFKIESFDGVHIGYASDRHNKVKHTLTPRRRKVEGYLLCYPDSNSKKFVSTLREAREYIDRYLE